MNFIARRYVKEATLNWLKAHWPAVGAAITFVLPFELPSIKAYIAANPHTFLAVLLGAVVAAYYAQSPLVKGPKP